MANVDDINRVLRDYVDFDANNPLPVGNPRSGRRQLQIYELRELLKGLFSTIMEPIDFSNFEIPISASLLGEPGSNVTSLIQQAVDTYRYVYIPEGYFYNRDQLVVPEGVSIVDDSTGIRVTNNDHWWRPQDAEVQTIAHRGGAHLAPENTLAAISNAYYRGFDGIEVDVRMSSDGVPMLMHDATIDRTSAMTGTVASLSAGTMNSLAYEVGRKFAEQFRFAKIPRLSDVLDYCRGRFKRLHLEIKGTPTNAHINTMVNLVKSAGLENAVIFISTDIAHLTQVRTQSKLVGVGLIDAGPGPLFSLYKLGGRVYCSFTNDQLSANAGIVGRARRMGIDVFGKVTNNHDAAMGLLARGITVIQSDNGVMCKDRAPGGPRMRPCYNLLGVKPSFGSPNAVIYSTRDYVARVGNSELTYRDTINIPVQLRAGESLYVEAYVRSISGDRPAIYISNPDGSDNHITHSSPSGDLVKMGGYLHVPGSVEGVYTEPLRLGFGALAAGTAEFSMIEVAFQSATCANRGGSMEALIGLTPNGPIISDNWFPRGVRGVFRDTSNGNANVIAVRLEGAAFDQTPRGMFPQVDWLSVSAQSAMFRAKFLSYSPPGGVHAQDACLRVGLFNVDGTPAEVNADRGYISISA